ncbi:beta-glucosidase-related glycosidase, partial [Ruthenibacterium lactatiformans]|nr:beta-glucosidase-related glycosidase [Ruthenibacterium lactatiformans]
MEVYEREHMNTVRALSPEGMVLLKSDGSFPLGEPGKIALYGNAARKTHKGGTGSGDVNTRHYVSVEEGLEHAGFSITTTGWLDGYDAIWN